MSHNVVSSKAYAGTLVGLVILTVVTVGASRLDLGHMGNVLLGLAIAVAKASLVIWFFMQMKVEKRWWLGIVLFPVLLVGIIVGLNMPDTGLNGPRENDPFGRTTPAEIKPHEEMDAHKTPGTPAH